MAKGTHLVGDDAYEAMASTFQSIEIANLDKVLRLCGIADVSLRRKVCERYALETAEFQDRCWFRFRDQSVRPLMCFSTQTEDVVRDVEKLGTVYAPSPGWVAYNYAYGNVEFCFSDDFERLAPETGVIKYRCDEDEDDS